MRALLDTHLYEMSVLTLVPAIAVGFALHTLVLAVVQYLIVRGNSFAQFPVTNILGALGSLLVSGALMVIASRLERRRSTSYLDSRVLGDTNNRSVYCASWMRGAHG